MVCRQIQETDDKKRKDNFALSIQLANKAVAVDLKDPQSWCKFNLSLIVTFVDRCTWKRPHDKLLYK